jgi:hypothetical protein
VVNAIPSQNRTGCPWDMLPHDLSAKSTAFDDFTRWREGGTWDRLLGHEFRRYLRDHTRVRLEITTRPEGVKGFVVIRERWVVEIVHSQMTKSDVLALGAGGEDVPDLDLVVGHHDAVHQQLDQLASLVEGRVLEPRRHPLAERLQRGGESGRPIEAIGLTGEL